MSNFWGAVQKIVPSFFVTPAFSDRPDAILCEQGFRFGDHLLRVGIDRENMIGLQVPQRFILLEMEFAAARNIQHHHGIFGDLASSTALMSDAVAMPAAE